MEISPPLIHPKTTINLLIKENKSLKEKLKFYQSQEKLYKSSIEKMKKYNSDCQMTFANTLNDYKNHENKIKKTYITYQKLLEKHYKSNENRFIEENNILNLELRKKNNIIKNLNKKIEILSDKLNKTKVDFHFKNKKLEDEVLSKDKKLNKLNDSMLELAKCTNDEIKLLRDEFKTYKKENVKKFRGTEGDKDIFFNNKMMDSINNLGYHSSSNLLRNKNISFDKIMYSHEEINYLLNRLNFLEYQNKNLTNKLKRKEEELTICNNLKNELFYNQKMSEYLSNGNKDINSMDGYKLKNLEKMVKNYGQKINYLQNQYNESLIRHQNEIQELKNNYENNINQYSYINNKNNINEIELNNNDFGENGNNLDLERYYNDEYFNKYDINEFQITNNKNQLYSNYDNISNNENDNSNEEIKDEYINSQLAKINTLD